MKPRKRSSRFTSKISLTLNTIAAWGCAFYALYTGQGEVVVASCLALIGALYGSYVGIGHLDYRRLLSCIASPSPHLEKENEDYTETDNSLVDCIGFQLSNDNEYDTEQSEEEFDYKTGCPTTANRTISQLERAS